MHGQLRLTFGSAIHGAKRETGSVRGTSHAFPAASPATGRRGSHAQPDYRPAIAAGTDSPRMSTALCQNHRYRIRRFPWLEYMLTICAQLSGLP